MKRKIVAVIEDTVPKKYDSDDGGMYLTTHLNDERTPLYVHIKSSTEPDEKHDNHATFKTLLGKRVRVTIEIIKS